LRAPSDAASSTRTISVRKGFESKSRLFSAIQPSIFACLLHNRNLAVRALSSTQGTGKLRFFFRYHQQFMLVLSVENRPSALRHLRCYRASFLCWRFRRSKLSSKSGPWVHDDSTDNYSCVRLEIISDSPGYCLCGSGFSAAAECAIVKREFVLEVPGEFYKNNFTPRSRALSTVPSPGPAYSSPDPLQLPRAPSPKFPACPARRVGGGDSRAVGIGRHSPTV